MNRPDIKIQNTPFSLFCCWHVQEETKLILTNNGIYVCDVCIRRNNRRYYVFYMLLCCNVVQENIYILRTKTTFHRICKGNCFKIYYGFFLFRFIQTLNMFSTRFLEILGLKRGYKFDYDKNDYSHYSHFFATFGKKESQIQISTFQTKI